MSQPDFGPCPPRLVDLKKQIAASYPDFEARVTKAWGEILVELEKVTKEIAAGGSQVLPCHVLGTTCSDRGVAMQAVPEVNFAELQSLAPERTEEIRRKGCVVIRDVVDDAEARTWQAWLREYVAKNPEVDGKSCRLSSCRTSCLLWSAIFDRNAGERQAVLPAIVRARAALSLEFLLTRDP